MRFALKVLTVAATVGLAGCSGDIGSTAISNNDTVSRTDLSVDDAALARWDSVAGSIEKRQMEYEKAAREAVAAGVLGGAVQGALLGALIQGEAGAFAGGVIGGLIGGEVARVVSSRLVLEHKNYVLRRESLDAVRAALLEDIGNVEFDLILAREFVRTSSEVVSAGVPSPQLSERITASRKALSNFYEVAIQRLLGAKEAVAADSTGDLSEEFGAEVARLASLVSAFGVELEDSKDVGEL